MDSYFYLFIDYCRLSFFFMSRCKQIKIKLCYLSKKQTNSIKHRTESQTTSVISFSLIFTRSYLPVQNLGDRHPNTIELTSCLVHALSDSKATWHQEAYFSVSWIHRGSTSCWCLCFTFLVKVLPPPFHFNLGSYLYLFSVTHFTKSKLVVRLVPVLKLREKMHYSVF